MTGVSPVQPGGTPGAPVTASALVLGERMTEEHIIGKSVPRKEGWDKITGAARYVDDMTLPGMLYGATVRSKVARAKIRKMSFDPSVKEEEYVLVTSKDMTGKSCIALILEEQPCLASGIVNHPE